MSRPPSAVPPMPNTDPIPTTKERAERERQALDAHAASVAVLRQCASLVGIDDLDDYNEVPKRLAQVLRTERTDAARWRAFARVANVGNNDEGDLCMGCTLLTYEYLYEPGPDGLLREIPLWVRRIARKGYSEHPEYVTTLTDYCLLGLGAGRPNTDPNQEQEGGA